MSQTPNKDWLSSIPGEVLGLITHWLSPLDMSHLARTSIHLHNWIRPRLYMSIGCIERLPYLKRALISIARDDDNHRLHLIGLEESARLGGMKALLHDAWGESRVVIKTLINWGCDVNEVNHAGMTLLHRTAIPDAAVPEIDRLSIAQLLLATPEIEVNLGDSKGCTALHLAAAHGEHQISELLLAHRDIGLCIPDEYGDTPLHVAIRQKHKCITVALLEAGADVVHHNGDGATPLLVAIMGQCAEMLEALLAYPRICVNTPWALTAELAGTPPLHTAIAFARAELVAALLAHPRLDIEMRTRTPVTMRLATRDIVVPEHCSALQLAGLLNREYIETSIRLRQSGSRLERLEMRVERLEGLEGRVEALERRIERLRN